MARAALPDPLPRSGAGSGTDKRIVTGTALREAAPRPALLLGLAGALLASAGVLYLATTSLVAALAFVLAAGVMLGGVVLL
ncbi:MAG: hypothetical protein ACK4MR_05935, partial [Erythrobacter cryptus]